MAMFCALADFCTRFVPLYHRYRLPASHGTRPRQPALAASGPHTGRPPGTCPPAPLPAIGTQRAATPCPAGGRCSAACCALPSRPSTASPGAQAAAGTRDGTTGPTRGPAPRPWAVSALRHRQGAIERAPGIGRYAGTEPLLGR
jgi:hypothetical protein